MIASSDAAPPTFRPGAMHSSHPTLLQLSSLGVLRFMMLQAHHRYFALLSIRPLSSYAHVVILIVKTAEDDLRRNYRCGRASSLGYTDLPSVLPLQRA